MFERIIRINFCLQDAKNNISGNTNSVLFVNLNACIKPNISSYHISVNILNCRYKYNV